MAHSGRPLRAGDETSTQPSPREIVARGFWVEHGPLLLLLGMTVLGAWRYRASVGERTTMAGLQAAGLSVGRMPFDKLEALTSQVADRVSHEELVLVVANQEHKTTLGEVGFRIDRDRLRGALEDAGKRGNPMSDLWERIASRMGYRNIEPQGSLRHQVAIEFLTELKERLDRPPVDAKLDLEHRRRTEAQAGIVLAVYPSLARLEEGLLRGDRKIALESLVSTPNQGQTNLAAIDIGTIMGAWQTGYSNAVTDSDRTYNLKIGASKVDGVVIPPHEVFSFNRVTGDRTEKEGYRVAPVIQAGELIDGLAGGMCQIASTLHAAGRFAGLEFVEAVPHSRPSAYITMGLDATVVYPNIDLKIRNPYDFPVVLHVRVNQGIVRAEILGKPRGKKVAYEREIIEEVPYETVEREDPNVPVGQRIVDQLGHNGFRVKRRFVSFVKRVDKPMSKPREQTIFYPPTTEYVTVGIGDPALPKKKAVAAHKIPNPEKPNTKEGFYRLVR